MRARTLGSTSATAVATGAVVLCFAGSATAADPGHGFGRMGPAVARTTTVRPASGADFEMPFVCGQRWTGDSRSGHSPSFYAIDFNTPNDLGKPAVASAPGVVTRAVTLKGSYGRYVVVDHGGGFSSLYAHLNKIMTGVGTTVDQGDLIGYVGGSGNVTGPHLHFEERKGGAYFRPYFHRVFFSMGATRSSANCTDRPVTGDWNGDGRAEVGVFRNTPSRGEFLKRVGSRTTTLRFGYPGDTPLVGNWGGTRRSEVAVRRPGTSTFLLRRETGRTSALTRLGYPTDIALTGDWDGDGISNLGFYRPSTRQFWLRSRSGSSYSRVTWGASGVMPVSGDWNKDGRTDVGVYNQFTGRWQLRVPRGSSYATRSVTYGRAGDLPVTGDWTGDGLTDLGTWRSSTATFWKRTPTATGIKNRTQVFGNRR
jgi:hypothetical protein